MIFKIYFSILFLIWQLSLGISKKLFILVLNIFLKQCGIGRIKYLNPSINFEKSIHKIPIDFKTTHGFLGAKCYFYFNFEFLVYI